MYLTDGPKRARHVFLFAHGAGAGMQHPWMTKVAAALGESGIRVVRFNFPYMDAGRGAPDRQPVLLDTWRRVVAEHGGGAKVAIGGKSMGGRMASMVADELGVRALVCFGYPFHPPGKPGQLRTAHLAELRTPSLVLQGERDPFGTRDEVAGYRLSKSIEIEWLPDGDHSLKPRKSSGATEAGNLARAVECASLFISGH